MNLEDERQIITDETIKGELSKLFKPRLFSNVVGLIFLLIASLLLHPMCVDNYKAILIFWYLVCLIILTGSIYNFVFYFYVIRNKSFYIIKDTLVDFETDNLRVYPRVRRFKLSLENTLIFQKSGAIRVSADLFSNLSKNDTFYIVRANIGKRKILRLYSERSYCYKENKL